MANIYRVEHKDTRAGPCSGDIWDACPAFVGKNDSNITPTPWTDKILKNVTISGAHLFGFVSLEQMRAWLTASNKTRLAGFGFVVRRYSSSEIIVGDKQAVFIRPDTWDEEFDLHEVDNRKE